MEKNYIILWLDDYCYAYNIIFYSWFCRSRFCSTAKVGKFFSWILPPSSGSLAAFLHSSSTTYSFCTIFSVTFWRVPQTINHAFSLPLLRFTGISFLVPSCWCSNCWNAFSAFFLNAILFYYLYPAISSSVCSFQLSNFLIVSPAPIFCFWKDDQGNVIAKLPPDSVWNAKIRCFRYGQSSADEAHRFFPAWIYLIFLTFFEGWTLLILFYHYKCHLTSFSARRRSISPMYLKINIFLS